MSGSGGAVTPRLQKGSHASAAHGCCFIEAATVRCGHPFTDDPSCVSPFLRNLGVAVNDAWGDEHRQRLVVFIPRLCGTGSDGLDNDRGYRVLDWLVRVRAPAILGIAPALGSAGAMLAALEVITDPPGAAAALPAAHAAVDIASRYAALVESNDAARAAFSNDGRDVVEDAHRAVNVSNGVLAALQWVSGEFLLPVGDPMDDADSRLAWDASWECAELLIHGMGIADIGDVDAMMQLIDLLVA